MFEIDDKEIKRFEADLESCGDKAIPYAVRNTLTGVAFGTQKIARNNVTQSMILRNKYTPRTIQVEKAQSLNINHMRSVVGSTVSYMEDQEFGANKTSHRKHGVPIATAYSAGQGQGARPRTRLPRRPNRMVNLSLGRRKRHAKNKKQAVLFSVQDAVLSGNRIVYLEIGNRKGIFRVVGGRRSFKRGWPKGAGLKMLWDLSYKSVEIPKNPWLKPAFDAGILLIPDIYKRSLEFQLKRFNLFKG